MTDQDPRGQMPVSDGTLNWTQWPTPSNQWAARSKVGDGRNCYGVKRGFDIYEGKVLVMKAGAQLYQDVGCVTIEGAKAYCQAIEDKLPTQMPGTADLVTQSLATRGDKLAAELKAERAENQRLDNLVVDMDAELERLRAALQKYSDHWARCKCTCGLEDALKGGA